MCIQFSGIQNGIVERIKGEFREIVTFKLSKQMTVPAFNLGLTLRCFRPNVQARVWDKDSADAAISRPLFCQNHGWI